MKRYLLILALAGLSSCAKNAPDVPVLPDARQSVRFTTEVRTRGVNTTSDNIQEFGVFCYDLKGTTWDPAASVPNKMNDLKVTRISGTSDWTYGDPIDWGGGDGRRFTFLGYSPCTTGTYDESGNPQGNNLEITTPVVGIPTLKYETLTSVPEQVDLLIAAPHLSITPQENVYMKFDHALTRVGFQAFTNIDNTQVQSIVISGVQYKGEVKITQPIVWTNLAADKTTFTVEHNPAVSISTDEANPTDLTDGGQYFFVMVPQDLSGNTDAATAITVTYIQKGTTYTKSYTIKEDYGVGKSTIYRVNLSGAENESLIVSKVTVTDWVLGGEQSGDADGEVKIFNLTYNAAGQETISEVFAGNEVEVLSPPANGGYVGWNTSSDMTGEFYFEGDQIKLTKHTTLYAQSAHVVHQTGSNCYPIVYGTDALAANSPVKALVFNALLKPRAQNGSVNQGSVQSGIPYSEGIYRMMNNEASELNGQQLVTDLKPEHIKRIEVVWQSNTDHYGDVAPATTVIKRIHYNPITGKCTVLVRGRGNAYIAAYDSQTGGNILWSWHIWSMESEYKSLGVYYKTEFMDRNLGAIGASTVAATNDNGYKYQGLFYTYGNKEPSPGIANHSEYGPMPFYDKDAKLLSAPAPIQGSNYQQGYNVVNTLPQTTYELLNTPLAVFATDRDKGGPVEGSPNTWLPAYGLIKTIYDPCPPGYMVPYALSMTWMDFVGDNEKNWGTLWNNSWWPNTSEKFYHSFSTQTKNFQIWSSSGSSSDRLTARTIIPAGNTGTREKRALLPIRCMRE